MAEDETSDDIDWVVRASNHQQNTVVDIQERD